MTMKVTPSVTDHDSGWLSQFLWRSDLLLDHHCYTNSGWVGLPSLLFQY